MRLINDDIGQTKVDGGATQMPTRLSPRAIQDDQKIVKVDMKEHFYQEED